MSEPEDFTGAVEVKPRRRGRVAGVLLGFVAGMVLTFLAVRYVPVVRDAWLAGSEGADPTASFGEWFRARSTASPEKSVASRMSYELSRAPAEPRSVPPIAPETPPPKAKTPTVETAASDQPVGGERIANARPISTVPPEPRDRTAAIQKEAQNPENREAPRQPPPPGRTFEGRDIQLKSNPREASPKPAAPPVSVETRNPVEPQRSGGQADTSSRKPPAEQSAPPKDKDSAEPRAQSAEPAAPAGKSAAADPVENRLRATREWLAGAPQTTHTIQLMGAPSEAQLKVHLQALSKVLEPEKLFAFRTMAQGKPSITVVYGAYADRQSALQALENLPPVAAAYRPVLRTVNGIRNELKQHGIKPEA